MAQKMEEDRLDMLREKLRSQCAADIALSSGRKEAQLETVHKATENISKEAEIASIIAEHGTGAGKIEEVPFVRAVCKSNDLLQRFAAFCSRGASVLNFDLEDNTRHASEIKVPKLDEAEMKAIAVYNRILAECWNKGMITPEEKTEFMLLIEEAKTRRLFADCFNKFRTHGLFSIGPKSFESISELLVALLDRVQKDGDVDCALRVLILSQTYYSEATLLDGKIVRVYLQQNIQKHALWQRKEFWEKAIHYAVSEEQKTREDIPSESEKDRRLTLQNSIFGKLGTFAHNMLEFNIPKQTVEEVIATNAATYGLATEFRTVLQVGG